MAEDSFGQLHVRGEHANLQYRINEVLLPEGIDGFGAELDVPLRGRVLSDRRRASGPIRVQDSGRRRYPYKTGALDPGGEVNFYGGSFDTINAQHRIPAAFRETGVLLHRKLFPERGRASRIPRPAANAIHDNTSQYRGFLYLSRVIDPSSRISIFGGASYADYQIPNNPGQAPAFTTRALSTFDSSKLNENQHQNNDYLVAAYQKTLGDFDFQAALFGRYSSVLFTPDQAGDLIFNGLAGRVDQSLLTHGAEFDGSYKINDQHTLRGGVTVTLGQQRADDPFSVFAAARPGAQTSDEPLADQAGGLPGRVALRHLPAG